MPKELEEEVREKARAIKKVYSDFLEEVFELKKEQREIIVKHAKNKEETEIEKIKKGLSE
jgi:hypothetical protein